MPNGGSDCCGTCWFNARNKGEAGYEHAHDPEPNFCTIRGLAIETPFWTYCANHPHRRPERDPIPIGPVFVDDGDGRKLWQPSPDTEEIRAHLLDLLRGIEEQPSVDRAHLSGFYIDSKRVVWQLGEFREKRAVPDLRRIAAFSVKEGELPFGRLRANLVAAAREALEKIESSTTGSSQPGGPKPRRAWVAALLTLAVPGLGQLYSGWPSRALAIFAGHVLLLMGLLWTGLPRTFAGLLIFLLAFVLVVAWDVWDAVRIARLSRETISRASPSPIPGDD